VSRRVIVLGGTGLFGRAALDLLRVDGLTPLVASRGSARRPARLPERRPAGGFARSAVGGAERRPVLAGGALPDLRLDAEDPATLRAALRQGDIVLDAAGPFQERSAALVETALEIGYDVVDLSDSLAHFLKIDAMRPRIDARGIRVLTSCSSVTTLLATLVRASGATAPARVSVFLSPASKVTATAGTGGALRHSLGQPIRILRGGELVPARGWRESRPFRMPPPIGWARGYLMESVHVATLPRVFPTIRSADFWVDSRVPGLNVLFRLLARAPAAVARFLLRSGGRSTWIAHRFGSAAGGMVAEIEDRSGSVIRACLFASRRSYLAAVAPAVLAVRAIASGRFTERGLVPHDRHVDPEELFAFLRWLGIECTFSGPNPEGGLSARGG
jgi:saccharopine dehydrogenase-like protein